MATTRPKASRMAMSTRAAEAFAIVERHLRPMTTREEPPNTAQVVTITGPLAKCGESHCEAKYKIARPTNGARSSSVPPQSGASRTTAPRPTMVNSAVMPTTRRRTSRTINGGGSLPSVDSDTAWRATRAQKTGTAA